MAFFTERSELGVSPQTFWEGMSMAAVNAELRPLVRMTAPSSWRRCPLNRWTSGTVLFRSVILLGGYLPVDVHSLRLETIDPAHGFIERSHSWMNRLWQHERSTTSTAAGCLVIDSVTVHSRIPGLATLLLPVYRALFRHRHRRLRRLHPTGGSRLRGA